MADREACAGLPGAEIEERGDSVTVRLRRKQLGGRPSMPFPPPVTMAT